LTVGLPTRNEPTHNDEDPSVYRLHEHILLAEDPNLFEKIVSPRVNELLEGGVKDGCKFAEVEPYLNILRNTQRDPLYYEDINIQNNAETCPVVFLFYFEGGLKLAETFFKFYSNIKTTRCLKFIVSKRWEDHPETREIVEKHGFTTIGKGGIQQGKTILRGLNETKKTYGDEVVVSVNDLDHLLVWFDLDGQPHRYSTYTDIVKLYVYELLSTEGCPDEKNVHEKYVVPCTCLMKNNEEYISTHDDGILWSEYGVTNRFHPTANFYLNETLKKAVSDHAIGTVFANLRNMKVGNIIVHHKLGTKTKKVVTRSAMCGIIHSRTDNMIQSLAKYQHYLLAAEKNANRDTDATISDAMSCSVMSPEDIIKNVKTCRSVKEFSNLLGISHQKLACLNAGYSEEHCSSDMSCCLKD